MKNNTNDKIRQTSFVFFLEKGYEATNIREICTKVNIKPSSLYFYYKSKQELFFSIYYEVWSQKINFMKNIKELNENISPKMKLYYLYKRMMEYYSKDISKEKLLLRYHMLPTEEISEGIRNSYRTWTNEKNKVIIDIITDCLETKILDDGKTVDQYVEIYKRFENYQVADMIITNTMLNAKELDFLWDKFWDTYMVSYRYS